MPEANTNRSNEIESIAHVEKLLYDKRSAAFALSVSVRTIETMLANKQLSYRRCGRKVLIPAADIHRMSKLEQLMNAPSLRD